MEREELKSMSLGDHLEELRARLILALLGLVAGLILSLFFGNLFLRLLLIPFEQAIQQAQVQPSLQAIKVAEPFMVYLKASMVLAILLTSPWISYQIWAFVSAGLYRNERRYVYVVAPISALLFIIGALFFLFVVSPLAMKFFVQFNVGIEYIKYQPSIADYVSFVLILSLVFGLGFQSPIAVVFAERLGLVSIATLRSIRKYVFLAVFVISAAATPSADVISLAALAIPLYILYEASILICHFWRRRELHKSD
jgi:sec-independent protein translocase protein TatC